MNEAILPNSSGQFYRLQETLGENVKRAEANWREMASDSEG